jgi:hypothetical protein
MRRLSSHRRSVDLVDGKSDMFRLDTNRLHCEGDCRKHMDIVMNVIADFFVVLIWKPTTFQRLKLPFSSGWNGEWDDLLWLDHRKELSLGSETNSLSLAQPASVGFTLLLSHLQTEANPGTEKLRIFNVDVGICWKFILRFTMLQHCYNPAQVFVWECPFIKQNKSTWQAYRLGIIQGLHFIWELSVDASVVALTYLFY